MLNIFIRLYTIIHKNGKLFDGCFDIRGTEMTRCNFVNNVYEIGIAV